MELIAGYKQTEIGVVPEEWDVKPLSEVLEKARLGGNYPNQDAESDFPLMKMGNIARGVFDVSATEYISPLSSPEAQHRLASGDVLFNTRNTLDLVGKVAIWREELPIAYYNSNLLRLEFKPSEITSSVYANYWLNTATAVSKLRALATGTTSVAAIYTRDLLGFSIAVPPSSEQSAIATTLSDVDALLGAQDALIAKKRAIKQGTMQDLLTGKRRLPGFSGEWEVRRLGEIATMGSGGTPNSAVESYYGGDIPWVSIADMTMSGKMLETTQQHLTSLGMENSAAKRFPAGTVLYAMYASLGECNIAGIPVATSQAILGIQTKPQLSNQFLYYHLASIKSVVKTFGQQGTQANLNKGMVQDFQMALPPLEEQIAIADVLTGMDAEISALEANCEKTAKLKQGMMQTLLTGRIRLV